MFLLKLVLTNIKYRQIIPQSYETQERLYPAEKSNKFGDKRENMWNIAKSDHLTPSHYKWGGVLKLQKALNAQRRMWRHVQDSGSGVHPLRAWDPGDYGERFASL